MKRGLLLVVLFLCVALSFTASSWAAKQCCCTMTCNFTDLLGSPQKLNVNTCWDLDAVFACEEEIICISEMIGNIEIWIYKNFEGAGCDIEEEEDCSLEFILGADDPGLDSLRQFRDEVLSTSEKGRKLTEAYYKYGDVLIEAFEENPGIENFATEILEKMIEQLQTALGSEEELLTDEIADDIEILIDELDAVIASPGLKKTLKQIKREMKKGTLF